MPNIANKVNNNLNKHVDEALGLEFTIPHGDEIALEVDKDLKNVPEGYAVIVLEYGDQPGFMYPQPVAVGGKTIYIPRASRRAIPINYLDALLECKGKKLFQSKPGTPGVEYEANRFNVQILKLPTGRAKEFKNKSDSIRERAERQQIHVN